MHPLNIYWVNPTLRAIAHKNHTKNINHTRLTMCDEFDLKTVAKGIQTRVIFLSNLNIANGQFPKKTM